MYIEAKKGVTSQEEVSMYSQNDFINILNALNGNIHTGKRFVSYKKDEELVTRLVYNKPDSLMPLVKRAESDEEGQTDEVKEALVLWGKTSSQRNAWSGVYQDDYKQIEYSIRKAVNKYDTGLSNDSLEGIKWLGDDVDQYFTPHIYNIRGGRKADNVRWLTAIYVDIDDVTFSEAERRLDESNLPVPTIKVSSGGGVHYYWILDRPAIANGKTYCYINTWRRLTRWFCDELGGDRQCIDIARLLRIPGTYNTKSQSYSKIEEMNLDAQYNILELNDQYKVAHNIVKSEDKPRQTIKRVATIPNTTLTSRTAPSGEVPTIQSRESGYSKQVKDDLVNLITLRDGDLEGYRHTLLFYYKRFGATLEELHAMNQLFKDEVPESDILAVSNTKDVYGKPPRRKVIMETLHITNEESSHLKQLVVADIVSARRALRELEDGFSKAYNTYKRYLSVAYASKSKKTAKDKATLLNMTVRNVYTLAKTKLTNISDIKKELLDDLINLIEVAVDVVEVIEMSQVDESELGVYATRIQEMSDKLNELNTLVQTGEEYVGGHFKLKALESKIIKLQAIA